MYSSQGRLAPYPKILQIEMSFYKLIVITNLIKMGRIIRDTGFGIFDIIQSYVNYVLGYIYMVIYIV